MGMGPEDVSILLSKRKINQSPPPPPCQGLLAWSNICRRSRGIVEEPSDLCKLQPKPGEAWARAGQWWELRIGALRNFTLPSANRFSPGFRQISSLYLKFIKRDSYCCSWKTKQINPWFWEPEGKRNLPQILDLRHFSPTQTSLSFLSLSLPLSFPFLLPLSLLTAQLPFLSFSLFFPITLENKNEKREPLIQQISR